MHFAHHIVPSSQPQRLSKDPSRLSGSATPSTAMESSVSWIQAQPKPALSRPWNTTTVLDAEKPMASSDDSEVPQFHHVDANPGSNSTLHVPAPLHPRHSHYRVSSRLSRNTILATIDSSTPSSFLQRKAIRYTPAWTVALLALGTTAMTVWYSHRVMVDITELPRALQLSPGLTVLVVNVLSHIVAFLALSLFSDMLEHLRWALACRPKGVLLSTFLAMSRATPITGVFYLFRVKGWHQLWASARILSYLITLGMSLILIVNVTFKTVYTPYVSDSLAPTHRVVGGLAPLGTTGNDTVELALIPLIAASYSVAFLTDPRFVTKVGPINCSTADPNCVSLLLPGGLELVRLYDGGGPGEEIKFSQSLFSGNFSGDYDTIVVNEAPSYQIEYDAIQTVDPSFRWNRTDDCTMYGQSIGEGIYVCQHEVGDSLYLGWAICPDEGVNQKTCETDQSWNTDVKWNTTVSLFSRRATVAYDRTNISILSVESVSDPIQVKVDGFFAHLYTQILLSPADQTLNWTQSPETYAYSANKFALTYGLSFLLRLYTSDYSTYQDGGVYLLRSFIAVPFQFSTSMRQFNATINRMPRENDVTATLSRSAYRAIIDAWTVWTFAWLSFILIFCCIGFLAWMGLWGPHTPNLSAFPEIDITSKSSLNMSPDVYSSDIDPNLEMAERTLEDLGSLTRSRGMGDGQSLQIVKRIRDKRVYCGSLPGPRDGEELVVLLTEEAGRVRCLSKENRYY